MTYKNVTCEGFGAVIAATVFALQLGVTPAVAQDTTSTVSQNVVTPGHATTVLVTGVPGYYYAVVGSTTGGGFSYAGVELAVGPDVQILAMGNLDGMGQAVVTFVPPFHGTSLDRIPTSRRRRRRCRTSCRCRPRPGPSS